MFESFNSLIEEDGESWIDCLPKYQKSRINEILDNGKTINEVANIWLSASPQNIVPFGTTKKENVFLIKIQEELESLLCGDEKYADYRSKLSNEVSLSKGYVIGVISSAIALVVGSSGKFIAPVIALLLLGMGKVTINAWCECCKENRRQK